MVNSSLTPQQMWHKYYLRRKERRRLKRLQLVKTCVQCGCHFHPTLRGPQTICSALCHANRQKEFHRKYYYANLEARRAQRREWQAAVPKETKRIWNQRLLARLRQKTADKNANLFITCKQCGERKQVPNGRLEYCSASCRRDRERQLQRERCRLPANKAKRNAFLRAKLKADPLFRLRALVSKTIWRALRKRHKHKNVSVLKKLPFQIPDLKAHLEAQFTEANGYTWANYGSAWDIDHIRPQAIFPYASMDCPMFRECWSLTNLRPLDKKANQHKHAKICQPT